MVKSRNVSLGQVQQEQSITERSRLEQRLEDLESKARALSQERVDLQVRRRCSLIKTSIGTHPSFCFRC